MITDIFGHKRVHGRDGTRKRGRLAGLALAASMLLCVAPQASAQNTADNAMANTTATAPATPAGRSGCLHHPGSAHQRRIGLERVDGPDQQGGALEPQQRRYGPGC